MVFVAKIVIISEISITWCEKDFYFYAKPRTFPGMATA